MVHTFISFPAGTARMNFAKFSFYTFIGRVPWVFALTYFGYYLGENWGEVGAFLHYLDYAVALAVLAGSSTSTCAVALDLRAIIALQTNYVRPTAENFVSLTPGLRESFKNSYISHRQNEASVYRIEADSTKASTHGGLF